ncbi:hypothetical protein [Psychrobacter sp. SWN149]|jgi:predicted solute-binding protein|uniref:hypothetical protein n=1 Tax=Psychrobacter sp. SWN149 TaxID=2792057 RepID=UPI0018CC8369|nr:hypothetical protein [Psychrobacter sp. SWN149]MBH0007701.1 hypothetical protein [Psychrobacter sp. SWN149]
MATIDTAYLDDLIKRFQGFKSPNDTQQLIVILGEKDNRSDADNRKLAVLMKAERKADQLAKARADARRLVDAEKVKARKAETRRKLIWFSAIEKMTDTNEQANYSLRMLMKEAFDNGFVSDRDKDAVRDDI